MSILFYANLHKTLDINVMFYLSAWPMWWENNAKIKLFLTSY